MQLLWKRVRRFLKKLKIELPYDPTIPLLGIYSKETKTLIRKDICTPLFIAALFMIGKIRKQPKCPSTDEWLYTYIYKWIYNIYIFMAGILLSRKKNEILPFATM